MAKGISDLGNGRGFIYKVDPGGTKVQQSITNDEDGARLVKTLGVEAASVALNQRAFGTIVVSSVDAGGSDITDLQVNSIKQITNNVTYAPAASAADVADAIATEVNSSPPASGSVDITAHAVDDTVYLFAPEDQGSSANGWTISVTDGASTVYTNTSFSGGSDADSIYDEDNGWRFYLDADYGSGDCSGDGVAADGDFSNAVEITKYVVNQGNQNSFLSETVKISGGGLTPTRNSRVSLVSVDTEASAGTDDLDDIAAGGFSNGDIVILTGLDSGRVVTVKDGTGNIELANGNDFSTGDKELKIALQFSSSDDKWYELFRSSSVTPTISQLRTDSSVPASSQEGSDTISVTTGGTTTLAAETDEKFQTISGSSTLSSNLIYNFGGSPIAGDIFIVHYTATVTVSGNSVSVDTHTLTDEEALSGGLIFISYYDGSSWNTLKFYDLSTYTVETANISDNAVTADKIEDNLTYDVITVPVSFETGEQGTNKVKVPYDCTVNEIYAIATKAIAATDDGTVTLKNNAGTTMTDGVITFTASDAIDTAYTATPSANNTLSAGDVMHVASSKATAGGKALCSIKVTRT